MITIILFVCAVLLAGILALLLAWVTWRALAWTARLVFGMPSVALRAGRAARMRRSRRRRW